MKFGSIEPCNIKFQKYYKQYGCTMSLVRDHSYEKPFDFYSCDKKFLQTPKSKYTVMKNHLAAIGTRVTRNWSKSHV